MDSGKFEEDLGGVVRRRAQGNGRTILIDALRALSVQRNDHSNETIIHTVSRENDTMDLESFDLCSEVDQMARKVNYYKSKLQSCREKYENVEMEISDVSRSQHKMLWELHHARAEEQNLQERLEKIHLDHEACVEKSGGYEDLDERIRATTSELMTQRSGLMQELEQLKRNTEDNCKKLGRVNAMITEQEEKNEALLRKLMQESENNVFIPQEPRRRINALLEHLKDEGHTTTANDTTE